MRDNRPTPLLIEIEQEEDGRWIAEISDISGVMAYGSTREEAIVNVQALALRVLAERLENGEGGEALERVFAIAA